MNIIATESGRDTPEAVKFVNPRVTADGQPRATVSVSSLETLWFNTGTLCNLTCENCYIESSPSNDRLVYLARDEVSEYLREIATTQLAVREIGITGGEPFMNPDIIPILEDCLSAGYAVIVLTNAMRPMMKHASALLDLNRRFQNKLTMRVSIDHYDKALHQEERGPRSWAPMIKGLTWLSEQGFCVHVAARTRWGDQEADMRAGFARLFSELNVSVNAKAPEELVLFPEMDELQDVPEITTQCWSILGVDPNSLMCASARMVVKRKGAPEPEVVACTLLPYESEFSLGKRLADSLVPVALNHQHCARFCVLGGGTCSG